MLGIFFKKLLVAFTKKMSKKRKLCHHKIFHSDFSSSYLLIRQFPLSSAANGSNNEKEGDNIISTYLQKQAS